LVLAPALTVRVEAVVGGAVAFLVEPVPPAAVGAGAALLVAEQAADQVADGLGDGAADGPGDRVLQAGGQRPQAVAAGAQPGGQRQRRVGVGVVGVHLTSSCRGVVLGWESRGPGQPSNCRSRRSEATAAWTARLCRLCCFRQATSREV